MCVAAKLPGDTAEVSELRYDNGEWTVDTVNDLSYVEAGAGI